MTETTTVDNSELVDKHTINGCRPLNASELIEPVKTTITNNGWKPGQSGNPLGRPKGTRNKVSQLFYEDVFHDWEAHGNQAIADMRAESPTKYVQMVASILPKTLELDTKDGINWVINASPKLTVEDWQSEHGLDDKQT